MPDAYVLEDATGGVTLEDGSGLTLLETPTYADWVKSDSPVWYGRLNDASGTTMVSDVGANGTYTGTPGLASTGLITGSDKAVNFDGVDDLAQVADASFPDLTDKISIEAWVKLDVAPAAGVFRGIALKYDSYGFQLNGLKLEFFTQTGATKTRLQTADNYLVAGNTYHLVGTYDGTNMRLYVNGTEVPTVSPLARTGAVTNTTTNFFIGRYAATEFFDGTIDEVAVYDKVLTAGQVLSHRNAGIA